MASPLSLFRLIRACLPCLLAAVPAAAMEMEDDPLLSRWSLHRLDIHERSGDLHGEWDADMWIGRDEHKMWLKTEGEVDTGRLTEVEGQILYGHAVSAFWDVQVGWRTDARPVTRHSLVAGFFGLAPYRVETGAWLFRGEHGQVSFRLHMSREFLLTYRWQLIPRLEINTHSRDDVDAERQAGLSELKLGMLLSHVINPQWLVYIGVRAEYEDVFDEREGGIHPLMGMHAWF